MSIYSERIAQWKTQQDEEEQRRQALMEQFLPFRDAFLDALEQFLDEASEVGLIGVERLTRVRSSQDWAEARFRIADLSSEQIFVAPSQVLLLSREAPFLSARMFIFSSAHSTQVPLYDVVVESGREGEPAKYQVRWLQGVREPWELDSGVISDPVPAARDAVLRLMARGYRSFRSSWKELPTLEGLHPSQGGGRQMGFVEP